MKRSSLKMLRKIPYFPMLPLVPLAFIATQATLFGVLFYKMKKLESRSLTQRILKELDLD